MLSSVLVTVFLRGGADGLALVPPYGDGDLYRLRPTLCPARPGDRTVAAQERALDLDGFFGLHPALGDLLPLYREGELAVVHAIGSDDDTRSHFEAQDRMEHGDHGSRVSGSGWLARLARAAGFDRGLSNVALGTRVPEALRGAPSVSTFESADEQQLGLEREPAFIEALAAMYQGDGAISAAGRDALSTLHRLREVALDHRIRARYPQDAFGRRLRELARVIRADAGVRLGCVDLDGWDTHFVQSEGLFERARTLALGLSAFRADLAEHFERTTIVVMSEFGRRAYENVSGGTDHGRGGVMFVLGAGVHGGRVLGRWPSLSDDALEPPGDVAVTTDYRTVLAELVERRFEEVDRAAVFPDGGGERLGVFFPA